ncbi:MAG: ribosomal protein S18-alanine N-acetyltransferase [Chromatiales bacterium]|jgi:ribosomal-protein-alanine N-acetyltransferase
MSAVRSPETYLLRDMTPADIDDVAAIESRSYEFPWTSGIFRDCLRVGYCCRVLCAGEQAIGYSIVSFGASEAHLLNLCILPDFHGMGLGRYLLSHTLEQVKQTGVKTVFLEVRPSNEIALELYRSAGFVEIGHRRAYYRSAKGREDALVLALELEI